MIIAADATTFARKVEEKIDLECANHATALCLGAPGIEDFAAYRFEVGYITALKLAKQMMVEAAQELSDPQTTRTAA